MKVKPNLRFGRGVAGGSPESSSADDENFLPPKNQDWEKPMLRIAIKQSGGLFLRGRPN